MATRAIKKLTKKDDLLELNKKNEELDSNEESDEEETSKKFVPKYSFNLLDELDGAEEKSDNENDPVSNVAKTQKKSNKKKKKQKAKHTAVDHLGVDSNCFEFKSSDIKEDDFLLDTENTNNNMTKNENVQRLFQIQTKCLSLDYEMVRMFGAKIVQSERNQGQRVNRNNDAKFNFKNKIVNYKQSWPPFRKFGLSMRLVNESKDIMEFAFEHGKDYQSVQFNFIDAVESLDHTNIISVLHIYPYHIDSLIQLSEVSRVHDDSQMATDLIERAIYAFQNSFHPSFNFSSKSSTPNPINYKFDYNRAENRGFFIVLFKHILAVGAKACYRTGLELCKLLYTLDLDNDPLGVILLIDFFAIRSSEYQYLIDFYEEFRASKHLNLMPNMIMSVSLAYFYLYKQTKKENDLKSANSLLQEALIQFPSLLMDLLEKCSVTPDKKVSSSWIFSKANNYVVPKGLKYLTDLYSTRMHCEWKIVENIQWLEKNVNEILEKETSLKHKINETKKKCNSLFSKVPPNIYRHLILSDLKEVPVQIPEEYGPNASYSFDPIPPKNSVRSYQRPERRTNTETQTELETRSERLTAFFQSLLPSFNIENLRQAAAPTGEAAAANNNNNNGRGMNQIVNRLRDFLAAIELNFPAEPRINPEGENNNNDDNPYIDHEEYD